MGSLVLLKRKDVIDSTSLLTTLFPILINTPSKTLRSLLYTKIISDLREANNKTTNHKLNRTIQTVLHNLVTSDRTSTKGMWACRITRELWRRQVWNDARPVDVMKEACLSDNEKVVVGGVRFFLGGDKEREEALEDDASDDDVDLKKVKHQGTINKKTKKRSKQYEKAIEKIKKYVLTKQETRSKVVANTTTLGKIRRSMRHILSTSRRSISSTTLRASPRSSSRSTSRTPRTSSLLRTSFLSSSL